MRLLSEGILMVRNKESTSTKDIRMARNISREDNREEEINYNTKDLNHEVPKSKQSLKQLPRYQIHHRSFLPAILFIRTPGT
jgi:hypothetical protein